jgi:NAD(P)H-nitrite reductase large subunit
MNVVIIGNGIAGTSAAIRLRRLRPDWRLTMVSGESTYPYSRPALMYIFMGHMRYSDTKPYADHYWPKHRIDLVRDWVEEIDAPNRRLVLRNGAPISYDRLLLATGSQPARYGWPGQHLAGVQGLYGLDDLQRLYDNTRGTLHAVIVGGGLVGIELAEMLHTRNIDVTFLVREESYWDNVIPAEESAMISRLISERGMGLKLRTQLAEIVDDGRGRVGGVVTDQGERITCQLVGLTAGVVPNVGLARRSRIPVGRGILVDATLATSVPDVFAAGDCAEIVGSGPGGRNLIQQVWYTGKQQGETAAEVIAGHSRRYEPGIWYNSAKFLDLEYQVYGEVNLHVPGEENLYWECATGREAVRLVHVNGRLIGVNLMGIRGRHRLCESWIRERAPIDEVITRLGEIEFEPEFQTHHLRAAKSALEEQQRARSARSTA